MLKLPDIHGALRHLKMYPKERAQGLGICGNLEILLEPHYSGSGDGESLYHLLCGLVGACAQSWSGYSGDELYPVAARDEYGFESEPLGNLWENPKRLELLDHLLELTKSKAKFPFLEFFSLCRSNPELHEDVIDEFVNHLEEGLS